MDKENIANPAALGLGAFALTTFLLNFINAGIIDGASLGMVLPLGLFYGGFAQFLCGMWDMKRGDIFGATCFSSYGAFWMALAVMVLLEKAGVIATVPVTGMAVFLVAWGIFTAYASVAAVRASAAVYIVFVTLTVLFFLLAWGEFNPTVKVIAGYEGIACALVAWYASAATLINTVFGKVVLPVGSLIPKKSRAAQTAPEVVEGALPVTAREK